MQNTLMHVSLITADYVASLRTSLESGVHYESYDRAGYGGVALYLTGTVGVTGAVG